MAYTLTFEGSRINACENNTNFSNYNVTGPAAAAEPELSYQGTNAINKTVKITSPTAPGGIEYDPGTGAVDMLNRNLKSRIFFLKGYISDAFDIDVADRGCEVGIGSANNQYYEIPIASNNSLLPDFEVVNPAQGGYFLRAIAGTTAGDFQTTTTGTPDMSAVDYYTFATNFVNGAAKAENLAIDAIDVGIGLNITGTPITDSAFNSFILFDQNTRANRYGVVKGTQSNISCIGQLSIGDSTGTTATTFNDPGVVINFPDGYVDSDLLGIKCYSLNASDNYTIKSLLIGGGAKSSIGGTTIDRRPNFLVVDSAGTIALTDAILTNFNDVNLTASCTVTACTIESENLRVNGSSITGSTLECNALTSEATIIGIPTVSTDFNDNTIVQTGVGHAILIDSATYGENPTFNFDNLTFTGFGPDTSDSAALDVTKLVGEVTINLTDTIQPTFKTAGATVTFVSTVSVAVTGLRDSSEVRIFLTGDSTEIGNPQGVENVLAGEAGISGSFDDRTFTTTIPNPSTVDIRVFHKEYDPVVFLNETITTNRTFPVTQNVDRVFDNPD